MKGLRLADGGVLARELEARPNDEDALFEQELVKGFDEMEAEYREEGSLYEEDEESGEREEYGELLEDGAGGGAGARHGRPPHASLLPARRLPGVRGEERGVERHGRAQRRHLRVLRPARGLDDDELAIVLGHELVHATHEHARRHFKKDMLVQLVTAGVLVAAEG